MKKSTKKVVCTLLCATLITGVTPAEGSAAKSASIPKKLNITAGESKKIKIKNLSAGAKTKWKITKGKKYIKLKKKKNTSVKVVAKKVGNAKICAVIGSKKLFCKISVTKASDTASTQSASPAPTAKTSTTPAVSSATPNPTNTIAPTTTPTQAPDGTATPDITPGVTGEPTSDPTSTTDTTPTSAVIPTKEPTPAPVTNTNLVGDVTFSQISGVYDSAFDLELESKAGETIYYTTDGSDPRTSPTRITYTTAIQVKDRSVDANMLSAIDPNLFEMMSTSISGKTINSNYSAPYETIDKCSIIKAVSCNQDGETSDVVTNTYFVGPIANHIKNAATSAGQYSNGLAVISISCDPDDLFDEDYGIYMRGIYYKNSLNEYLKNHNDSLSNINVEHDITANFKQKGKAWERPCHIDYFETNGNETELKLAQDCGIRIQGNYSRQSIQKSFRLYARADYGEAYGESYIKKNFKYPFFDNVYKDDDSLLTKFKTLVLRNGGNDFQNYKYKDIFLQSFANDLEVDNIHGRPCVVYIDGEYWGYYVLQDDLSDSFLGDIHDVNKDSIVAYKATDEPGYEEYDYKLDEGNLPKGEKEDYYLAPTLDYLKNHNMADEEVYKTFMDTYMSEQSVLDYFALQLYLGNGWDWPGKNWEIWKTTDITADSEYGDGKWRFCLNDLDLTTEPTWSKSGTSYRNDNSSSLYDRDSNNVLKVIFTNLIANESFREALYSRISDMGNIYYEYTAVKAKADAYKTMYSALFEQCKNRFLFDYTIGAENHDANMNYLSKRMNYIPTIISSMRKKFDNLSDYVAPPSGSGDFVASEDFTTIDGDGSCYIWEGSWTRGGTANYISKLTTGLTAFSESQNFVRFDIPSSATFGKNAYIKVSVADGYAENARLHVWDSNKTNIDSYLYQNTDSWIGKEISLNGLGAGDSVYVNVVDSSMVKIEIGTSLK